MSGHKAKFKQSASCQVERAKPKPEPVRLMVRVRKRDDLLNEQQQFLELTPEQWVQLPFGDLIISVRQER